jgi:hypothetical protein
MKRLSIHLMIYNPYQWMATKVVTQVEVIESIVREFKNLIGLFLKANVQIALQVIDADSSTEFRALQ